MKMINKKMIYKEIDDIPNHLLEEVFDFIRFIKTKSMLEKNETAVISESSLAKDWLSQEEETAWKDL